MECVRPGRARWHSVHGSARPVPEHQNLVPHLVLKTIWFLFWFWNWILKSYPIPVQFLLPGTSIDDSYHETEYLPNTWYNFP
jgi:hypothetical protein